MALEEIQQSTIDGQATSEIFEPISAYINVSSSLGCTVETVALLQVTKRPPNLCLCTLDTGEKR